MREVIITSIVAPLILLIAGFLVEVGRQAIGRKPKTDATPVVGTTVPISAVDTAEGWRTAYQGAIRERDDEIADHAHTIDRHRVCHGRMEDAGIPVPDDHL